MNELRPPRKLTVAYLGPQGTHSHAAAVEVFGPVDQRGFRYHAVEPALSFEGVLETVTSGDAHWAVLPYCNVLSGAVQDVARLVADCQRKRGTKVEIWGLISRHISQDLLGTGTVEDVREVRSKAEALRQCQGFIRLKHWKVQECNSTGKAIQVAESQGPQVAAIASAKLLEFPTPLRLLEAGIQDAKQNNVTEFAIFRVGHSRFEPSRFDSGLRQVTWVAVNGYARAQRLMAEAHARGVRARLVAGPILFADSQRVTHILELGGAGDELRIRFLLSDTAHLWPVTLGSPVVAVFPGDHEKWGSWMSGMAEDLAGLYTTASDPEIRKYLPAEVADRLDSLSGHRLYVHQSVKRAHSMQSAWGVLGVPPTQMVNTQILRDVTHQKLAFCCVTGTAQVDDRKVLKVTSGDYHFENELISKWRRRPARDERCHLLVEVLDGSA